jgi:hypothetical protein
LRWRTADLFLRKPLAESPRRHGPIAAPANRQVGPLAFAFPIPVAVELRVTFSRTFFRSRRRIGSTRLRAKARLGRERRPALFATTSSFAARLALPAAFPFPVRWPAFRFVVRRPVALKISRLDVGDVKEAVATDRKVDERRLDGGLEIDDPSLVDVARVTFVAGSFDVELLENAVLHDRDAALFRLEHVDQHFFLHAISFHDLRRRIGVDERLGIVASPSGESRAGDVPAD